ncbi:Uncharacterized membrane protein, predicted efflux pump [Phaffia rhodozyma]|uniref:Uncharacterized membrane protein, predicted efflux pump n=1 Tax=Phaffia rhodozyma TaxID=264483 RepID=A0A0F7SM64_PHARH|nr:Uncharacterized membrane protein, predicted efflux pump [Phaffia rhodozyma]
MSLSERQPLIDRSELHPEVGIQIVSKSDPSVTKEFTYLVKKAIPLILGFILESSVGLTSAAIVGRKGPLELAIVGQGFLIQSVTTNLIVIAATSTQMTLSSPLYTSPTHAKTDVGVVLQRTIVLANLGCLPIFVVWWFIEPIMLALGQPPSLAHGLKGYLRLMMFSQPGYALMEACKNFLQVQGMMSPSTYIIIFLLPIHILLASLLTFKTSLGIYGTGLSVGITYWLFGGCLVAWIKWSKNSRGEGPGECWGGWGWSAFEGWAGFTKIWAPAIMTYSTEWWAYEIVALLAGRLGETAVTAQAGLSALDGALCMIPYAIGLACTARLGNLMGVGESSISEIRSLVKATVFAETATMALTGLILFLVRGRLGYAFTHDKDTVSLIKQVVLPMATYQISDGLQNVGASVLRATGRQSIAAVLHVGAYYVIGLPFGYFLAFHQNLGLVGLWWGQVAALSLVAFTELLICRLGTNWKVEVQKAEERGEDFSTSTS